MIEHFMIGFGVVMGISLLSIIVGLVIDYRKTKNTYIVLLMNLATDCPYGTSYSTKTRVEILEHTSIWGRLLKKHRTHLQDMDIML